MRVAINGFGRIGRLVLRHLLRVNSFLEVVAINDLVPGDNLAYLFKYDSTHGTFSSSCSFDNGYLLVEGKRIQLLSESSVEKLPWNDLRVDCVIESTGRFTSSIDLEKHLQAGARRVVLTAPAKDSNIPTFVMGVNHKQFDPKAHFIISNASCTTNCLAPLAKIISDSFGIEEGLMTTVHAATATQAVVDSPSRKDWRSGRGVLQNIIPASTGAAKAVTLCLPELKNKLTGMAFRVPVANVSVVDLTVRLTKSVSYENLCQVIKEASEASFKGILKYTEEQLVSSDCNGSTFSSIFDAKAGIALNDYFFKLISWYDNETGYSARVVDLVEYVAKQSS